MLGRRRRGGAHLAPSSRYAARRRRATLAGAVALAVGAAAALVLLTGGGEIEPTEAVALDDGSGAGVEPAPSTAATAASSTSGSSTTTTRGPRGSGSAVTIAFAGDIYAEGLLADRLLADPDGFVGPFAALLGEADLAVGNLESAITERGAPIPGKAFTFRAPADILGALRAGGFDVVSLANNHGMDFGPDGLEDSLAAKRASGGFVIGIGADEDEAYAPYSTVIRGQRVAVIAATQVLDSSLVTSWTAGPGQAGLASAKRVGRLVAEVEAAREVHDTVVVHLHWGIETHECPARRQLDLAATLREAGADVIVGGHAHRVQGGGLLDGAAVHYGLGNFLFQENSAPGARTGVFLVTVAGREVESTEWVPGRVVDGVPRPLEGRHAADELARWGTQRDCTDLAAA